MDQVNFRVDYTITSTTMVHLNRNDVVNVLSAALLGNDEQLRHAVTQLRKYANELKAV